MRRISVSLLVLLLLGMVLVAEPAAAADKPAVGLRYASLTPDNQHVVFAYRGDIWIAPVDGKKNARRLTIHEAQDTVPRVSPDGKQIAFISRRTGGYDVFLTGIDGGLPKQITYHAAAELACDWSPDGKRLLIRTLRHPNFYGMDLYEVDLAGGTPRRVTPDGARDGSYAPDGKRVVYDRGFNTIYWDNYEGGANFDLYVVDEPGALPRRLTEGKGNERWPYVSADGKTVYYIGEAKGLANFYAIPIEGGAPRQVTRFKEDVWRPRLAWDRKTAVFEMSGKLYLTDLTAKEPKPTLIPVVVNSDVRHSGVEKRTITTGPDQVDVSPGGDRLAFAARGDIWTMPVSGGPGKRLTSSKDKDEWPRYSPDGRSIAYMSDKGGDSNIWLLDLDSGKQKQLTRHRANDFYHNWSPDGEKLVFCSERGGNRDLWTLELDSGKLEQLTRHPAADDDPSYSRDGEWIAFDSAREGSQAIYVMPAEGGDPRRVTTASGYLQVPSWSPDGSMLVYEEYNQTTQSSGGLFVISARGGPAVRLTRNGSTACWSPKGDYVFYTVSVRGKTELFRHPAPTSIDLAERVPFLGEIEVDRRSEFGNLFDEVWTRLQEGFYDEKMHGVNWGAMKTKYRPMAVDAEIKSEFQNVVSQMLAELGASHLGLRGGNEPDHMVRPELPDSGFVGMEFASEMEKGGGRRVTRILPGGPADKIGLRIGDVVTRLGRKKIGPKTNLDRILTDAEGKDLPIAFRPVTTDGLGTERRTTIKAVPWRDLYLQTYRNWIEGNTKLVKDKTKGRAGYLHLQMMDPGNLNKFRQTVARWNRSRRIKGMVLDVRFNGGGNIHVPLLQILTAKPFMQYQVRGGRKTKQPDLYWGKPVVVLINERSYSDAEVFPAAFRACDIGKIVGTPTAAGVIGTNDVTLSDGSTLRIPRVGYFNMDGVKLEGKGVHPDVLVVLTPEDRREGRDPQLERAIEVLLADIEARAKPKPAPVKPESVKPGPVKPEHVKPGPVKPEHVKPGPVKPEHVKPGPVKPEPVKPETPRPEPVKPDAPARHPLRDVKVGEWVRYRCSFGGSTTLLRHEVVAVEDDVIRFRTTVEEGGEFVPPLPEHAVRAPVRTILEELGRVETAKALRVTLKDGEAAAVEIRLHWEGNPVDLVFTNAVPALGLYKATAAGEVVAEAIAWGASADGVDDTPAAESEPEEEASPAEGEDEGEGEADDDDDDDAPAGPRIENPLFDAEVGEWIRYRQVGRGHKFVITMEVVEVDDEEVVYRSVLEAGGETREGPEIRQRRTRYVQLRAPGEVTISEETATVGDAELACTVVKVKTPRGVEMEHWFCKAIPATGTVRVVRNGKVVQELLEWGTDGAPD